MTKTMLYIFLFSIILFTSSDAAVLKGSLYNVQTNQPIPFATISISENSQTVMTNDEGSFVLHLEIGTYNLTCSHIAYYSDTKLIEIYNDTLEIKIELNPSLIELPTISVYDRNYDAAQAIIIEAIRHKDEILAKLKSYQFEAYTKLLLWDATKLDSLKPMLVTETELTAYWKYPSDYKEIITARKQSSNLDAENNLVSVGEVLNFNNNRIKIGTSSIVSPTAKDALDYYNYYLLDTLFYDSLPVYLLEIEPKSNSTALFVGRILINAKSYEIMGIDIHVNEGLDSPYLKKLKLVQEYSLFENKFWMPTIVKFDGIFEIAFPLIPNISFSYTAALQRYEFEQEQDDTLFSSYALEVARSADDFDSTQWLANRFIPLTYTEEKAYEHIDSVKQNRPLLKKVLPIIPAIMYTVNRNKDFFHFNRVEGAYLGGKFKTSSLHHKLETTVKAGYAFDAELWQQDYTLSYLLARKHRLKLEASYHDNIQTRKTLNSRANGNATTVSLFKKIDPYDYFREKGFSFKTSFEPLKQITFSTSYNNFKQFSISNNSDYSFKNRDSVYRENLPINDGTMKSIQYSLTYDSNKRMNNKGKEEPIFSYPYTLFKIGSEISNSSFLNSDFEFTTLYGQLYTTRQMFGLGISSLGLFATTKLSGELPPQRYTVMDFGSNILDREMTFKTMYRTNFSGSELVSGYLNHNFGTKFFKKSHLPLIKKIPYSLSIHGGVFWSKFSGNAINISDDLVAITNNNPFSEIGFAIGRLPMMTKVSFTWQLSTYNSNKFSFGIGFDF